MVTTENNGIPSKRPVIGLSLPGTMKHRKEANFPGNLSFYYIE